MIKTFKFNPERVDYAARKVYGLIITLALIISLQAYSTSSVKIIITILGTLFVIALAETYVHYVALSVKKKGHLSREDFLHLLKEEFSVMVASEIPVILFILEIIGLISLSTAFLLAEILGVVALFIFGYVLGTQLEKKFIRRLCFGLISSLFGLLVISLKLFFH